MDASVWSTQQLAEFIAALATAETESEAARAAVERVAEALDAEVTAIVAGGVLVASIGYPEGTAPVGELARVRPGVAGSTLDIPGVGVCPAAAAALDHPPGATLVIARSTGLSREETGLVRGMARVAATTMRLLRVVGDERAARAGLERLAGEQAALRRVAMRVAEVASADQIFSAVAAEVGRVFSAAEFAMVARYDSDESVTVVGWWSATGDSGLSGRRMPLGGQNVCTLVFERSKPARVAHLDDQSPLTAAVRSAGARSSAGAPITVAGRLWGVMIAASACDDAFPAGTEHGLAEFTGLVATAIANAQTREELQRVADEQAALRRVATLVAAGAPPATLFAAVAEEAGRLLPADLAAIGRYNAGGTVTFVGAWDSSDAPADIGLTIVLGGRNVTTLVAETGRPARLDTYAGGSGAAAARAHARNLTATVGVPICVAGRLWGLMTASAAAGGVLALDIEQRLAGFAELVATAIANAQARAELTASRARVVATADDTRRRIERDLHDGAQQRLVSLALQLRAVQATVPPELRELSAELGRVGDELYGALEDLREFARGIHPAILADGGLGPALRTLARRSSVPVELSLRTTPPLPERIQVTVYYVVSEALANAAKHAGASVVRVEVAMTERALKVTVADDGVGGADPGRGSGLVGLRDRVEAAGGRMRVRSRPGEGTGIVVELPLDGDPLPAW